MARRMERFFERRPAADRRERAPRGSSTRSEITDLFQSYSRKPRSTRTGNGELSIGSSHQAVSLGGFDCEFIDSVPDSLQCPVCFLPFRDPQMLDCCGAKFCSSCIEKVKTDHKPCPICRHTTFNAMLDKNKQRKVLGLRVYCTRKSNGCEWVGELRCLEKHMTETCDWAEVSCRYCDQKVFHCCRTSHEQEECPQRPAKLKMDSLRRTVELRLISEMGSLKQELKREMDIRSKGHTAEVLVVWREMDSKASVADHKRKELRREMEKAHNAGVKELRQEMEKAHKKLQQDMENAHRAEMKELQQKMERALAHNTKMMDNAEIRDLRLKMLCSSDTIVKQFRREMMELQQKIEKAHNARMKELRQEMERDHNAEIRDLRLKMICSSDTIVRQFRREMDINFTIHGANLNDIRKKHCLQMFILVALFVIMSAVALYY